MKLYEIFGIGGNSLGFGGGSGTSLPSITDTGALVTSSSILNLTAAASTTNAAIRFNSVATTGVMFGASTLVGLQVDASNWMFTSSNQGNCLTVPPAGVIGWSSSSTFASAVADAMFGRRAAASIRLGAADVNGGPVAQTLSVQNAITGSNLAAANFTFNAGLGTGTGTVGTFVIQGGDSSVASGTTAQTQIVRCVLNATKALTTGAATTLVSIPLASLQMTGGYVSVYMEATDGTSQATRCEEIYYAAENSAGVFVTSAGVVGTGVTAATATKTLTATYALTSANPALLQVTPTLTGITATRFTCIYEVHHMGNTQPTV